jgi:hypothetical protein
MEFKKTDIINKINDDTVWIDDNTWFLLSEIKETGMSDWFTFYYLTRKDTLIVCTYKLDVWETTNINGQFTFTLGTEYENYLYQKFLKKEKLKDLPSKTKEV